MSVKLGIAPIAWSNDDMPELGGDTPLEQCLSEASQAGYIGIESGGKFPKTSKELLPKLEKYNLKLCSGWYSGNLRKNSVEEEKKQKFLFSEQRKKDIEEQRKFDEMHDQFKKFDRLKINNEAFAYFLAFMVGVCLAVMV